MDKRKSTATRKAKSKTQALARIADVSPHTGESRIEALARDKRIDVVKLEKLIAMQERFDARQAEMQFNAAMTAAQKAIRPVFKNAHNPETHSRYATYEQLDEAIRPIYVEHGFGLSFDTGEARSIEEVRVLCYVSHIGGHSRPYKIDMPADGKGPKGGAVMSKTHATGSGVAYGMRYLLRMIFNVTIADDDGNKASRKPPAESRRRDEPIEGEVVKEKPPVKDEPITQQQRQRLVSIVRKAGREEAIVRAWLKRRYGVDSSKDLPRSVYSDVCSALEASGVLPEREPGE